MSFDCIKTGCGLYDPRGCRYAWGDLYQYGDTLVLHAQVVKSDHQAGETPWLDQTGWSGRTDERPCVEYVGEGPFFEKRGVIVMHIEDTVFNKLLNDYVGN